MQGTLTTRKVPRKKKSPRPNSRNLRIRGELREHPDPETIAHTVIHMATFLAETNQTPEEATRAKSIHDDTITALEAMGIKPIKNQPLPNCTCITCWGYTRSQT